MKIKINVKGASRKKASIIQIVRDYPDRKMTVEEFLTETVKQNVREYNSGEDEGALLRFLSEDSSGNDPAENFHKVTYGDLTDRKKADPGKAVRDALQYYDDGIVALFADGVRYEDREQELPLRDQSEVTFVRLTFLAGRIW